jgi:Protein of unknown function (DUF2971)
MENIAQFAGQTAITSLYHYQDFDLKSDQHHLDRLVDILKHNRVYCSNPADFNDPWDCRPYFDPDLLDDPTHWRATAEYLIANKRGPNGPTDDLLRTNLAFLKRMIHEFSARQCSDILRRWAVYCLSVYPDIALMWSHYSRNHTGVCLEFAVKDTIFRGAQRVVYSEDYPPLLLHQPESYIKMLRFKSDAWRYEHEFRLICSRSTGINPLVLDGNYISFEPSALRSITLGCRATGESIQEITRCVRTYSPRIVIRQAKQSLNKYALVIDDYGAGATA